MARTILIKPLISEKAEKLSEDLNQYSFIVARDANKVEIKNAVAAMYNVAVSSVNTIRVAGKSKNRNTRSGLIKGTKPSYKKAIVKLAAGEEIDFFGDI
jgi:large subunit ribosomal protein L23